MFAMTKIHLSTQLYRIPIMKLTRSLMMTSAAAMIAASPALADLTAEQVLADQLKQMDTYGLNIEVTGQSRSGDTLTVDGLAASAELPEGGFEMTMGGAFFTELGDGTVAITYPDEIPVTLSGTSDEGEAFEMVMTMTQSGTRTIVSGTPEEIRYDFTSDSFSIAELKFNEPAEAAELDLDLSFTLTGLSGMMELGGGTVRDYTAQFAFETITGLVSGTPEGEGTFNFEFSGQDIAADYTGRLAKQELMGSFAEAISNGNRTNGKASHGAVTYNVTGDGPQGSFEMAAAIASGLIDFNMDQTGLSYGGTSTDMTMTVGGSAIPFPPMTFKLAESGGHFAMPVVPSENEQGFALRMSMVGLELDQMLWGMVDPAGQLPRDPATLIIDVDGDVVLTEDIFDPEVAEDLMGPPGQVNAVNVNEVKLNLAGAELTGDGAFTFNNETGMPMPSGVLNMMLTGGNGLLDTLVGMGLVPEEQAMGARMMMGLFARPGDGEDTLVSTIEVNEDGSVLANGQRIK